MKRLQVAETVERDLRAVRQLMRRPLDAMIAQGGLTGPQQAAMSALVKAEGLSLKELSRELGLAHSTVSGIVDRLEKRGMVERKTDSEDRRVSRVVPTRQVLEWVRETMPELERHPLAEALARATEGERKAVAEGVGTLRRLLESATDSLRSGPAE